MRRRRLSGLCIGGGHHACADGAAIACRCSCHRTCVCSQHPSLGSRTLTTVADSPENAAVVVDAATRRRDNGAEIEGRSVGEGRPPLVASSFPRCLP